MTEPKPEYDAEDDAAALRRWNELYEQFQIDAAAEHERLVELTDGRTEAD